MHTLATIICYEVLENVECPSSSMKCCLEAPANGSSTLPPPQYTPAQRHPSASHSTRPTDSTPQSNPNKRIQVQLIINQFFLVFTQKKLHICITHKSMKFEREFQNERNNFYKKKVSNNFLVIQNVPLRTQPHCSIEDTTPFKSTGYGYAFVFALHKIRVSQKCEAICETMS